MQFSTYSFLIHDRELKKKLLKVFKVKPNKTKGVRKFPTPAEKI